jgi:phosphoribosylaminoimidazole-succinocarboxamide synthase
VEPIVSIGGMAELTAELAGLELHSRGKVREMYDLGDCLLMVASDRISAYDVVLPTPIPDKGKVLTGLSVFWFGRTGHIVPGHLVSTDVPDEVKGRAIVVRKLDVFPVECVVRGYLSGSGWREYREHGSVCGISLPPGLRESDRLPEPIFTPATKAEVGAHDENIDFERAAEIVGDRGLMEELRRVSIELYRFAAEHAAVAGIVLADTKFELGRDPEGRIVLADEVLTPDSSRFWPLDAYRQGAAQPSFDKQYVRDWLDASGWDHTPPAPELPSDVVANTRGKYVEAYERITGEPFERWSGATG